MISNLAAVKAGHRRFLAKHARMLDVRTRAAALFIPDYVREHPTFRPRTGKLQGAVRGRVIRTGGRVIVIRGDADQRKAKYAPFVEFGTRPHLIRAKKKALRFTVRGQVLFRRSVQHPGTRPYKFLYRATFAAGRKFGRDMQAEMGRIASTFGS